MALSISTLFTLIIVLVALALLVWLAFYILQQTGPPDPLNRMIRLAIIVIAVLIISMVLLSLVGIVPPISIRG